MGTRLYVGNLSFTATEDELREHFNQAGTPGSIAIVKDRATGRSRGFAFVEMSSDGEARKAIEELDGKEFKGRPLRIDEARSRLGGGGGGGGGGRASGWYGGGGPRGGGAAGGFDRH
jgi:RNA recognition motif-containing protein